MLLRQCKVEKDPTDNIISEEDSSSDDSADGNYEPPSLQPIAKRTPARKESAQYKPMPTEADCYLYRSADDPDLKTKLAYTNGPCFDVITVQRNRKLATADVLKETLASMPEVFQVRLSSTSKSSINKAIYFKIPPKLLLKSVKEKYNIDVARYVEAFEKHVGKTVLTALSQPTCRFTLEHGLAQARHHFKRIIMNNLTDGDRFVYNQESLSSDDDNISSCDEEEKEQIKKLAVTKRLHPIVITAPASSSSIPCGSTCNQLFTNAIKAHSFAQSSIRNHTVSNAQCISCQHDLSKIAFNERKYCYICGFDQRQSNPIPNSFNASILGLARDEKFSDENVKTASDEIVQIKKVNNSFVPILDNGMALAVCKFIGLFENSEIVEQEKTPYIRYVSNSQASTINTFVHQKLSYSDNTCLVVNLNDDRNPMEIYNLHFRKKLTDEYNERINRLNMATGHDTNNSLHNDSKSVTCESLNVLADTSTGLSHCLLSHSNNSETSATISVANLGITSKAVSAGHVPKEAIRVGAVQLAEEPVVMANNEVVVTSSKKRAASMSTVSDILSEKKSRPLVNIVCSYSKKPSDLITTSPSANKGDCLSMNIISVELPEDDNKQEFAQLVEMIN